MYIVNINPLQTWPEAEPPGHRAGTLGVDVGGNIYACVQANGVALAAHHFCIVGNAAWTALHMTKARIDANEASHCGIPRAGIPANHFGWLQLWGYAECQVLASAAKDTALYTSATAGALDDASASQTRIYGVHLTTARSATAGVAPCVLRFPTGVQ